MFPSTPFVQSCNSRPQTLSHRQTNKFEKRKIQKLDEARRDKVQNRLLLENEPDVAIAEIFMGLRLARFTMSWRIYAKFDDSFQCQTREAESEVWAEAKLHLAVHLKLDGGIDLKSKILDIIRTNLPNLNLITN